MLHEPKAPGQTRITFMMMQQQIIGKPTWVGLKDTPMGAECLNSDFVTWASILGTHPDYRNEKHFLDRLASECFMSKYRRGSQGA